METMTHLTHFCSADFPFLTSAYLAKLDWNLLYDAIEKPSINWFGFFQRKFWQFKNSKEPDPLFASEMDLTRQQSTTMVFKVRPPTQKLLFHGIITGGG